MEQVTLKINYKYISLILLMVIGLMFGIWQPWASYNANDRVITVNGQSTVKAAPNKFIFSPIYSANADTSSAAISKVTKTGDAVVAKLITLGFLEKDLKKNISTNQDYRYAPSIEISPNGYTAQYSITAVTTDSAIAQKAFDYIVTTSPLYGVSPQSTFTDETQKEVESQARAKALADARSKADQSAKELGFKLGSVVSVSDAQWGGIMPMYETKEGTVSSDSAAPQTSSKLLVGENDVTYTVSVVYKIR
ncbi:SIMPL domain-containing protein [Candidatus Berkelbacteria bacterium]|nr:SIMPL domain-containing protein [Candidatus Berkelbacteria bacterium]